MNRSHLSLGNTQDIIANNISLIQGNDVKNLFDLFLTRGEADDLVGIAPDTLNTLQEIALAIGNDPDFFTTINNSLALKANISDTYISTYIDNLISNYHTKTYIDSQLNIKFN